MFGKGSPLMRRFGQHSAHIAFTTPPFLGRRCDPRWAAGVCHEVQSHFPNDSASRSARAVSWLKLSRLEEHVHQRRQNDKHMMPQQQLLDEVRVLHSHVPPLDYCDLSTRCQFHFWCLVG